MKEGTKSYLIGCHQFFFHPLWVLLAWRLEYKAWPQWWELIGIFLHDIGICGRQYLSDDKAKKGHWLYGAELAYSLVYKISKSSQKTVNGLSVYLLIAGHSPKESGVSKSKLFQPDKRSWLVAPMWWLWWNYWIEGFAITKPPEWKKLVAQNLRRNEPYGNHEIYLHQKAQMVKYNA